MDTLTDFSSWNTGVQNELDMVVIKDSPALRWLLRRYSQARFEETLAPTDTPTIVITEVGQELPSLALSYRGQDLYWDTFPAWQGALPSNWISWLTFRQAPLAKSQIILWARSDAFPGGDLAIQGEVPVPEGEDDAVPDIEIAP
jgi:hypothetical protein